MTREEQKLANQESKARQQRSLDLRRAQSDLRDMRKDALSAATSASERRSIKESYDEVSAILDNVSSSGGDVRGALYDISTGNYKQPENNQQGQNKDIDQAGIDSLGASVTDSALDFNGTVGICINGSPYWMDIIFDDDKGTYDVTEERAFDFPTTPA